MKMVTKDCSRCEGTGNIRFQTKRGPRKRKGCSACGSTGKITRDVEWAKDAVARMSPEQVAESCRAFGIPLRDTRSPIDRMIDSACGQP